MDALVEAAATAGVETHTDTRAVSLVVEDGRVVGVRARRFGADVEYRAARGVVLTTGGFVDNERMLADHAPALLGHGKVSDGLDDGSGITMALQVGAATRRMHAHEIALTYLPALAVRGLVVDGLGQRFVNEDSYPGIVSHAAVTHRPAPYWVIVDETGFEDVPERERWGCGRRTPPRTWTSWARSWACPRARWRPPWRRTTATRSGARTPGSTRTRAGCDSPAAPYAAIDVAAGFHPGEPRQRRQRERRRGLHPRRAAHDSRRRGA